MHVDAFTHPIRLVLIRRPPAPHNFFTGSKKKREPHTPSCLKLPRKYYRSKSFVFFSKSSGRQARLQQRHDESARIDLFALFVCKCSLVFWELNVYSFPSRVPVSSNERPKRYFWVSNEFRIFYFFSTGRRYSVRTRNSLLRFNRNP